MISTTRRTIAFGPGLALLSLLLPMWRTADAQSLVQVPYASVAVGIPATTYNGTTIGPTCTTPGFLDTNGDGCPPTQATLIFPYAVAIDKANNMYIAEYGSAEIRVVYQAGAALAAALVAGEPKNGAFTPIPGDIYNLGGALASLKSPYYCNGSSGATGVDSAGDGCPVQYSYIRPRNVTVDSDGNIFISTISPYQGVRVIYVGGTTAANLITAYNPKVTAPLPGYIYALSAPGDFVAIRDLVIDANENLYASDNGAQAAVTGLQAATSGNQIKKFSGTGWTSYINGTATAGPGLAMGDGGPASLGLVSFTGGNAWLELDGNNNLYIADGVDNRIRLVYSSGPTPPLYIEGLNANVVANPVSGNIYTLAGGGSSTTPGSPASNLSTGVVASIGLDAVGNLLFMDVNHYLWREDSRTGIAVIIAGNGALYTSAVSPAVAPGAGVPCNGASGGPVMTDAYSDGCPASEVYAYGPSGRIAFDTAGNLYQVESRFSHSASVGIVRRYSYNNQFGSLPVGSPATTAVAYTPTSAATYSPSASYLITGDSTSEFYDGGNDLCSLSGPNSVQTCAYTVGFTPALAGSRLGALTLSAGGTTLVSTVLGGVGIGSQTALDPATQSVIGTGLTVSGLIVDQGNNLYLADNKAGSVYRSLGGATPTLVAGGFSNPGQLAVNGSGNVYVADSGNNRVAVIASGATTSFLTTFSGTALNAPSGVVADASGNVFVADTGNNRVLKVEPFGNVSLMAFHGLSSPLGLAIDSSGGVFVADSGNARVVELTPAGVQTTVSPVPSFVTPVGVSLDPAGDLYVADAGSQNTVLVPAASTNSSTLLGNIPGLTGVATDTTGNVYIALPSSGGAVKLNRNQLSVKFPDTNVGQTSTQVLQITDTGNATLTIGTSLATGSDTTNFSIGAATTNGCSVGQGLPSGQNCDLAAVFQPQVNGAFTDAVSFPNNAANVATASLVGNGVQKIGTTSALSYVAPTGGLPLAGQPFSVMLTVTATSNLGAVGGTVMFAVDGGSPQNASVQSGVASASLTLPAGSHTVVGVYSGDANYVASSATLTFQVVAPASTSIANFAVTGSGSPMSNQPFTVSATVTSSASQGAITGTIVFAVNGAAQTITLLNGTASAPFTLPVGKYNVTATYSGNSYYLGAAGSLAIQVIPAGTSSVSVSVVSPAGTITIGQPIVVNAAITTGNATAPPGGTVTFTVDNGAAQILPYASSVSASLGSLNAGLHTVTATYSGDNSYAPGTGSLAITVLQAAASSALMVAPNVTSNANTYTLTANITSPFATPTGTVTFTVGGTALGSAQLVNGTAKLSTTTSTFASYNFTASYSGDSNFLPSTFGESSTPDFVTGITTSTLSVPQYGTGVDFVQLTGFYGYNGTIQLSCTGLPANSICRGTPTSNLLIPGTTQNVQLQIFADVNSATARLERKPSPFSEWSGTTLAFCLLLGMPWAKRQKRLQGFLCVCGALALSIQLSGCASNTANAPAYVTPTGSYKVTVSASDGQLTRSSVLTLTILPGSPARP